MSISVSPHSTLGDSHFGPVIVSEGSTSVTGQGTPNYRQLMQRGLPLPENPYTRNMTNRETPVGLGYVNWTKPEDGLVPLNINQGPSGAYIEDLSSYAYALDKANAKSVRSFYSNAKDSDAQALVAMAEMPRTFGLIADTAKRAAGFIRGMKRGDVGGAFKSLDLEKGRHFRGVTRQSNSLRKHGSRKDVFDHAANTWLEVKYGWKPLLYDIEASAELMARNWSESPVDITIKGSGRYSVPIQSALPVDPFVDLGYPLTFLHGGSASGTYQAKVRYTCNYQVLDPSLRNANVAGLINLSTVVWELIPYSFIFDWFIPFGDFIEAQTALYGLNFISGSRTDVQQLEGKAHLTRYRTTFGYDIHYQLERFKMDRNIILQAPSAISILNSKGLSSLLNFDKAATALSLLNRVR